MMIGKQMRAYIFLALAMSIAGSAVVAGKLMVSAMPIFLAAELGIFISLLILLPLAYLRRREQMRLDARTHLLLLAQAVCGVVLCRIFIFWGLLHTSAAAGGLISSAAPAFIALMAFLLLREKMPAKRVLGLACVSVGLVAVNILPLLGDAPQTTTALKGNCLVLAAVICESLFSVMSKARCAHITAMYRTTVVSLYAFIFLLPFAIYDAWHYDLGSINTTSLLCVGYYGVFVSFLSYMLWFKGISTVPAGLAASFTGFVPLSSIFLSWLILRERIHAAHWLALICVLVGIYLSCVYENPSPKNKEITMQA